MKIPLKVMNTLLPEVKFIFSEIVFFSGCWQQTISLYDKRNGELISQTIMKTSDIQSMNEDFYGRYDEI